MVLCAEDLSGVTIRIRRYGAALAMAIALAMHRWIMKAEEASATGTRFGG